MIVTYDDGKRGWVDSVFESLDEYWVSNEKTKELEFQALGAGDVRSFQASELTFTGQWSRTVESEAVVQVPPEVVGKIVGDEDFESTWEEKTKVVLQIEHLVEGAPGRILIGPGYPPDVKAAERVLVEHIRDLVRNQEVTESIDVSSAVVERIQAEDNWEKEWEEQADVKVQLEPFIEDGVGGRIQIGPGPKSVVTKAVALLTLHIEELGEAVTGDAEGAEIGEVSSEDLQMQLERLKADQEAEFVRESARQAAEKAGGEAGGMDEDFDFPEGGAAEEGGGAWSAAKSAVEASLGPRTPAGAAAQGLAFAKAGLRGPPPKAGAQAAAPPQAPEYVAAQSKASGSLKARLVAVSSISRASALARAARAKLAALDAGEEPEAAEPEAPPEKAAPEGGEEGGGGKPAEAAAAAEQAGAEGASAEPAAAAPAAAAEGAGPAEGAEAAGAAATAGEGAAAAAAEGGAAAQAPAAAEGAGAAEGGAAAAPEATGGAAGAAGGGQDDAAGQTLEYWMKHQDQFSDLPPLPPNWIRIKSKSMGYVYYANLFDGTTTLQEPGQVEAKTPLPTGWIEVTSRSTGQIYYHHLETGHSQFVRPLG